MSEQTTPNTAVAMRAPASAYEATEELKRNIAAYEALREDLERTRHGRFALLHDGNLVNVLNDRWDAYLVGRERFGEGRFSITKIGEPPATLGAATLYTEPVLKDMRT